MSDRPFLYFSGENDKKEPKSFEKSNKNEKNRFFAPKTNFWGGKWKNTFLSGWLFRFLSQKVKIMIFLKIFYFFVWLSFSFLQAKSGFARFFRVDFFVLQAENKYYDFLKKIVVLSGCIFYFLRRKVKKHIFVGWLFYLLSCNFFSCKFFLWCNFF